MTYKYMSGEKMVSYEMHTNDISPVVSVLMITYNHERFVEKAIRQVINQKCSHRFELVVADDCSTDGTRDIVLSLQREHPGIVRVVDSEKNVGANANFARCYQACRGNYIAICEGDDYWSDELKLDKQVSYLEANPDCVVTYHDAFVVDENDTVRRPSKLPEHLKRDFSRAELAQGAFLLTLTMCFRKIFDEFPEEFFKVLNADTFLVSLLSTGGRGHYQSEILNAGYREHSGGIWSSQNDRAKYVHSRATYAWLSYYYLRQGEKKTVNQIQLRMIAEAAEEFGVSKLRVALRLFKQFLLR